MDNGLGSCAADISTGRFLYEQMIPSDLSLSDTVQSPDEDDKALFINFVRKMLNWVAEQRKTATELLEHPWLDLKAGGRRSERTQTQNSQATVGSVDS